MAKILLVDDDQDLVENIGISLKRENFVVEGVHDGDEALDRLRFYQYDLVILDLGLPSKAGLEILAEVRSKQNNTPVIILTGRHDVTEKMTGLDTGADDYLTKPVDIRELKARIRAILRRASGSLNPALTCGALELDCARATATINGAQLSLTHQEFAVLEFLLRNKGKVFSSEALLQKVWSDAKASGSAAVRQCILRLRKKLETQSYAHILTNISGVGYKVDDP